MARMRRRWKTRTGGIRDAERNLDLAHLSPPDAIRHLVSFTLDYYHAHPSFVALVVAENQSAAAISATCTACAA